MKPAQAKLPEGPSQNQNLFYLQLLLSFLDVLWNSHHSYFCLSHLLSWASFLPHKYVVLGSFLCDFGLKEIPDLPSSFCLFVLISCWSLLQLFQMPIAFVAQKWASSAPVFAAAESLLAPAADVRATGTYILDYPLHH